MPNTSPISQIKSNILPVLKQHHVIRAGLFGSLVRDEMTETSDIDILVELPLSKSLLDFVGLKLDLEAVLHKPVDLVEYVTLHPRLRDEILREEIPLMKRDVRLFLEDILESFDKIEHYTIDMGWEAFWQDDLTQDAVSRRIEIIGEAVKNLPREIRTQYPHIPWQAMAGMRDVIIHAYWGVNLHRMWEVIEEDIPRLRPQIQAVLTDLDVNSSSE